VAYKEDTDHVVDVLREVAAELRRDPNYAGKILDNLEILGVDAFADSAVMIKIRIKTVPIQQWSVAREMRRRIKKVFDHKGIEIPFPHMSVYFGEASKPFAVQAAEELAGRPSQPTVPGRGSS
jgi:small conductance mechanosensitive channel